MTDFKNQPPKVPLFKQVRPESQKIWRYLNFEHFVDLLSTKTLYFSRVDKIGDDPLEGMVTDATIEAYGRDIPWANAAVRQRGVENFKHVIRHAPYHVFVNCWHMNDIESMFMWKEYAQKGIVIQSTIGNLKNSIVDTTFDIHYAEVEYITEMHVTSLQNIQIPFGYKRKIFEYENEFRAIHTEIPEGRNGTIDYSIPNPNLGIRVPANIARLIDHVYIFPYAPQWFYECTKSVMEKYDVPDRIEKSKFTVVLNY